MKKYIVPTIGAVAFVIGGLITRSKTLDGIETLESVFNKKKPEVEEAAHAITDL